MTSELEPQPNILFSEQFCWPAVYWLRESVQRVLFTTQCLIFALTLSWFGIPPVGVAPSYSEVADPDLTFAFTFGGKRKWIQALWLISPAIPVVDRLLTSLMWTAYSRVVHSIACAVAASEWLQGHTSVSVLQNTVQGHTSSPESDLHSSDTWKPLGPWQTLNVDLQVLFLHGTLRALIHSKQQYCTGPSPTDLGPTSLGEADADMAKAEEVISKADKVIARAEELTAEADEVLEKPAHHNMVALARVAKKDANKARLDAVLARADAQVAHGAAEEVHRVFAHCSHPGSEAAGARVRHAEQLVVRASWGLESAERGHRWVRDMKQAGYGGWPSARSATPAAPAGAEPGAGRPSSPPQASEKGASRAALRYGLKAAKMFGVVASEVAEVLGRRS